MSLEVVIPVYKPDNRLKDIVLKLNEQLIKPDMITIIVSVDDLNDINETDFYKQTVFNKANIQVQYIDKADFGHGKTRQNAVNASDADYIIFMTQDAVPYDNKLTLKLLEGIHKPFAAAAYARQIPYPEADAVENFTRRYNYRKHSHSMSKADLADKGVKAIFLSDSCAIYNREVHRLLGGFDCSADFNEDCMFAFKALKGGYTIEYCAEARVYHSHNFTLKQNFKRNRDIGHCQKQHPEVFGNIVSEKEGLKYVLTGLKYFLAKRKVSAIFALFCNCAVRYVGFFVGKHKS